MRELLVAACATGIIHIAVVTVVFLPLLVVSYAVRREPILARRGWRYVFAAVVIYLVSIVVLHLPRIGYFTELMWNWQNKLLLFAALLLLASLWPTLWRGVGFTRPTSNWWFPVTAIILASLALQLAVGPVAHIPVTVETFLFQAIVPGLDEELLFRGVLFALIVAALPAEKERLSMAVTWAVFVTTLLFGVAHGVHVSPSLAVTVDPAAIVYTAITGALLGWVRVHTGSLWPAILLHNGINVSLVLATAVMLA